MDVVTTRHPRRATATPVRCSTRPPTGRAGPRANPGPPEPDLRSSPRLSYKAWGCTDDDRHLGHMCGIAGFWDRGAGPRRAVRARLVAMTDTLRHRGPDDERGLRGRRRRRGAGHAAAGRRRPVRARASAHGVPRRALRARLQRRDLQLPRPPPGARGGRHGAFVARATPRSSWPPCQHWGLDETLRALQRDVRLGPVGPARAAAAPGPGPVRGEAAVLRLVRHGLSLRLGAQGAARPSRLRRRRRPGRAGAVLPAQLCARPVLDLPGLRQAPPGLDPDPGRRPRPRSTSPTPCRTGHCRDTAAGRRGRTGCSRSIDDAADELDVTLRRARRLCACTPMSPLGAFLSGGIDSSLVVALMQAQHTLEGEDLHHRLRRRHLRRGPSCSDAWPIISAPSTTSSSSRRATPSTSSPGCPTSTTSPSPTPRRSRRRCSPTSPGPRHRGAVG